MPVKRAFEVVGSDDDAHILTDAIHEPPTKRRLLSTPQRPHVSSSTTPYPDRPFDSPSNPFGRKRTKTLIHSLPPPTSFSKHLPLRFQLVQPNSSPRLGGTYRIVQVPLSYTFVHLRCLIGFLYGGGYLPPKDDKHLFEVKKKVMMYSQTYKPGQIRSGFTAVKLSSVRDPCRYRPEADEDAFLSQSDDPSEGSESEEELDECEGWVWEAEEHFTLTHAWPRGGDLARGIIYHHTPTTAVHITINTTPIPRRKGISNVPFVFNARGRFQLFPHAPMPLPRPVFSVSPNRLSSPIHALRAAAAESSPKEDETELTDADADGDADPEVGDASSTGLFDLTASDEEDQDEGLDSELEEDDPSVMLSTKKFNASGKFAAYLKYTYLRGHTRSIGVDDSDSDEDIMTIKNTSTSSPGSTPGLACSVPSSSPVSSSPFPLSSPPPARTFHSVSSPISSSSTWYKSSKYNSSPGHGYGKLKYPAYTPAPPHALWHRLRIERVEKRMGKKKRESWMCSRDEDEEEEKDELDGDDDSKVKDKGEEKENEKADSDVFVKPVLAPGEVWDPFGDEYEL